MNKTKNLLKGFITIIFAIILGLIFCEMILRIKHHFIINYDIEMWKYAKQLKKKVENKKINHTHVINKSANLQKVNIKINKYGQRDKNYEKDDLKNFDRSFLILGSSVALGWGVDQEKTFSNILNKQAKNNNKNWLFVNGGIGNYNTERYINNYFENWEKLGFSDIIINFFVNDTEIIKESNTNIFTLHTHLGVITWKLFSKYKSSFLSENLNEYYKIKYDDKYPGYITAVKEIKRLKQHCEFKKISCHIVLMPDIHQLKPYKLKFINTKIFNLSKELDLTFLDLLSILQNNKSTLIWNDYNDPHPSAYAHSLIGEEIFKFINNQ